MNKRAAIISEEMSKWVFKAIFLVVLTIFVLFVVRTLSVADVHAENLRAESFLVRTLVSPSGLSYHDRAIDRFYPKTIDLARYGDVNPQTCESKVLSNALDSGSKLFLAARLDLTPSDATPLGPCKTIYYNHNQFDQWIAFSFDQTKFFTLNKQIYTLLWNGQAFIPARLQVQVVTPVG